MEITDTHVHLYSQEFDTDRDEVIERAMNAGVQRFFLPAVDSESAAAMHDLEARFPGKVFLMTGLHPVYVKPESYEKELEFVAAELERRKFCAVGEIGIDLYWDQSTLEIQKIAFRTQIQLAKRYKLPINIHCREAFDEIFEVLELEKSADLFGIFHCFTGSYEQALKAISYNMKLGIGGVVTFKNGKIDTFLAEIPLSNIVLETDAPYLAPAPFRGKRNESSFLLKVLEKLSAIYKLPAEEIAAITTQNSRDIYGI